MVNIEQLVESLSQDATVIKPVSHPYLLSLKWLAVAITYLIVSLYIAGVRPDLAQALQNPWFMVEITLLCFILVTTALSTAILSFPDMYQKRGLAFSPFAVVALFIPTMLLSWYTSPPEPLPIHSFECTISILFFSFFPTVVTFYAIRQLASTHQCMSGSVAVLFSFSIGALWLRLHEQTNSIIHVIEWHYFPTLVLTILGMWLGKKLLKW